MGNALPGQFLRFPPPVSARLQFSIKFHIPLLHLSHDQFTTGCAQGAVGALPTVTLI